MLTGERCKQVLLVQLGGRVDVARIEWRVLRDRPREQRGAARRARRIEQAAIQVDHPPGRWSHHTVVEAPVSPLAIHDHRRGEHDAATEVDVVHRREPHDPADVVHVDIVPGVGEVDPQADLARLVAHRIDAREHRRPRVGVAHVTPHVASARVQVLRTLGVRVGREVVEHHDLGTRSDELVDDV